MSAGHKSIRCLLAAMQRGRCFYCERDINTGRAVTLDHVVPRALGGRWVLVASCIECNGEKADRYPLKSELQKFLRLIERAGGEAVGWRKRAAAEAEHWLHTKILLSGPDYQKEEPAMPTDIRLTGAEDLVRAANTMAGAAERISQAAQSMQEANAKFLDRYERLVRRAEEAQRPSFFARLIGRTTA